MLQAAIRRVIERVESLRCWRCRGWVAGRSRAFGVVSSLRAVEMPPTRYAKTSDGVHIAYQVYGDGPVDILLSGSLWWHLEFQWTDPSAVRWKERFARLGRVIEFDKRGTGLSDRVPVDRLPTLEQRIDDITAVLDAAG